MSMIMAKKMGRLAASRALTGEEIALIELYQRQDALSMQLWQHFLLTNMAVVFVTALIAVAFPERVELFGISIKVLLAVPVLGVWGVFCYGGLSTIQNCQSVLLSLAHQIEGDVGDKTALFSNVTRSVHGVTLFQAAVNFFIFWLCVLLIWMAEFPRREEPVAVAPVSAEVPEASAPSASK